MYIITYSLKNEQCDSESFCRELSDFTEQVLKETDILTHTAANGYVSFLLKEGARRTRSKEEYGFELLVMGVLWQVYSGDAGELAELPGQLLHRLSSLRMQGGSLKPGIDFIRGMMSTLFLAPDLYDNISKLDISLKHLDKLLDWLSATGEFTQEVLRLRQWQRYMETLPDKDAEDIIASAITLAAWFDAAGERALGKYTANVDRYLNELRPAHYWHEDVIFCGRRRVEYHMNMVGAEIMNRAFRKDFLKTAGKAVLLPACMRLLPSDACKARSDQNGLHCRGCTEECSVNRITKLGRKYGFKVLVVSHESSISAGRNKPVLFDGNTGIVGVACVLNLISGGWMLDNMGVPAQCVFLDYCGCRNHWSREGIPTEINVERLKKILGIDDKQEGKK